MGEGHAVILGEGSILAPLIDLGTLGNTGEEAVLIDLADTAGNGAMLGDGVAQAVAHHGVSALIGVGRKVVVDGGEGGGAIKVIGVDDGEGTLHGIAAGRHSVTGTPGLAALGRSGEAFGQIIDLLEDILDIEVLFSLIAYRNLELLFDLLLDDEDHIPEACAPGVKHGKVNDLVALRVHRSDLLETTEAAAHASSHNHESGFGSVH